jgi:hypothetical protein
MQICVMHSNIEVAVGEYSFMSLAMSFPESKEVTMPVQIAVFDSDSFDLYRYCKEQSFSIEHELMRNWTATIG